VGQAYRDVEELRRLAKAIRNAADSVSDLDERLARKELAEELSLLAELQEMLEFDSPSQVSNHRLSAGQL
jgi:ribosomal protein S7